MQSLQEKASEWSGVATSDAFAIDETNLFESLGGIQPFIDLSTNFYTRFVRYIYLSNRFGYRVSQRSEMVAGEARGIFKIVRSSSNYLDRACFSYG